MNADRQDLDAAIRGALAEHGTTIGVAAPDFGVLVSNRQRRTRRLLASATATVAVIGLGGVVFATNRSGPAMRGDAIPGTVTQTVEETPLDTRSEPSTPGSGADPSTSAPTSDDADTLSSIDPATTAPTTVVSGPAEYSCTDPLGEDPSGRQLFGSCEPRPGELDGDYACTDRLGGDDGFVRFSFCEPVGQLGPLPDTDGDAPFDNPDDLPVRATTYVVQAGDYGLSVAEQFCVSVADLESVNGWADISREFPFPGVQILIPDAFDDSNCDLGSYTITVDDMSRSQVADMFCVSVQALDTANVDTEGYSAFYPGLKIVIPPSPSQGC